MAERGAIAARQHGRHPPPSVAELRVTDRVDTAMNAVEAGGGHAARNTGWGEAGGSKLIGAHYPVLVRRDTRNHRVRAAIVAFLSHSERKATNGPISPPSPLLFCGYRPVDGLGRPLNAGFRVRAS